MSEPASFRFAFRPKWLVGHVLALAAVIGFVNLGFWQLRRHDERATSNAVIDARMEAGVIDWAVFTQEFAADAADREYRIVSVTGEYEPADEMLWQARTLEGRSGHDVVTPLVVDGRAVLVDRGWVPIDATGPPVSEAAPPGGPVTLTAMVREGRDQSGPGPRDPATGVLERIARVDIERIQQQFERELYPFYLLLMEQVPAQSGALPVLQALPSTDAGPHLGYAVQWFVFAAIAAIGYPVLLIRTSRDRPSPPSTPSSGP